ncbi:hypothetical protein [Nocardia concava]|uniref:hypothetical protein n=1 Tax=Nocardia concava TaxID=257281 RepID=UPI001FDEFF4A|nr:hypothetical protein [Nocardia concava]
MHRLRIATSRAEAQAVFVPSVSHFDNGEIPDELASLATVVAVDTERTFPRIDVPARPGEVER